MLLQDIFDNLTYGELKEVKFGGKDEPTPGIQASGYPEMVVHLNLALAMLHKRFPLRSDLLVIEQITGTTIYTIAMANTVSNAGAAQYIKDTALVPFPNNLIKIEQIFDKAGCEIPLNDVDEATSIHTPKHNALQVPIPATGTVMNIIYQASHPRVLLAGLDPLTEEIDIPAPFLEPLLSYMAYRVLIALPTLDGVNKGNELLAKYKFQCKELEDQGIAMHDTNSVDLLRKQGWV